VLLVRPTLVAGPLGARPGRVHPVFRLLGARHLVAALALWKVPTPEAANVAAAVDAAHVTTCLGWAGVRAEDRRPALGDAVLESSVALATLAAGRLET
jgi:hypothetical protein